MVRGLTGCSLIIASLFASPAHAGASALGVTAAKHPTRDVPTLLWAAAHDPAPAGATAEQAARFHLERVRSSYKLPRAALARTRLLFVHDTGRGGIIVALRQTVAGVDVVHSDVKVLLDRSHNLVAIAGTPHPLAHGRAAFTSPTAQTTAVAVALRTLYDLELGAYLGASREPAKAGFTYIDLAAPGPVDLSLRRPARVKPVWFPVGDSLVPAHVVEVQAVLRGGKARDAHALTIDLDGRILHRKNLIARESFKYRTYAEADGRPLDSPLEDYNPHPFGEPINGPIAAGPTSLVSMEGFNTNPEGEPDPWLDPGATETRGNNIDAYVDHYNPSGLGGPNEYRASTSAPNTFDYVYDISKEPLADKTQSMAAIVSLFYTNNWLHDWFYDSGFTEAAGNAQIKNFDRGGVEDDVLLAEAQDAALDGARNNANMSTPEDGESPVMQMYLWSPLHSETHFTAGPPDKEYPVGQALFGPRSYDVTAELVLVDDGSNKPTHGCEPPVNDVSGKIVLVDRGTCSFELKATHLQDAGAVGVAFPDSLANMDEYPPGPDGDIVDPTIPAVGMSKADGAILKAALLDGPVTAHMLGDTSPERDGTLDNGIVAHEWGHYLHHRLVTCGTQQCGGHSEGWGDFNALLMSAREGDDLDATFTAGVYGTFDETGYFSNRRVAYSVDMAKNPLTLKHISDGQALPPPPLFVDNGYPNAEVHNSGEVWSTMMWEVYVGLHKAHADDLSFEEVHRRMSDYVVAGMMMTAVDPTYTEQRDGILAAVIAADPDDFLTVAEAFARRGVGTCAVAPEKLSVNNAGVVEDFEVRPNGVVLAVTMDDSTDSCDDDGVLDTSESGKLHITVRNAGVSPLIGATVTLSSTSATLEFTGGNKIDVPDLDPQTQTDLSFDVALVGDPTDLENTVVTVALDTPDGCETASEFLLPAILNGDIATGVSATDDVEPPITTWTVGGTAVDGIWARVPEAGSFVWNGQDHGGVSDTWLTSPTLEVSDSDPFVVRFDHAYSFEYTTGIPWDGGFLEFSSDAGATWIDVSTIGDPGYGGPIVSEANPQNGRPAFIGASPGFPALKPLKLDFGTMFAGKSVQFRFRIATDAFVSAPGWFIDNLAFTGITNTPFARWVPDAGCDPVAPTTTATTSDGDSSGDVPTTGPDAPGSSSSAGEDTNSSLGELDDGGCGCTTTPAPAGVLSLFGLLALRRRRRRSA